MDKFDGILSRASHPIVARTKPGCETKDNIAEITNLILHCKTRD